jgi:D-alanyl-D-alanine carboxypeptidase/D-alanyl-D-alanine-endopeptidase (penicillin-binding protein 4)
LLWVLPGIPVGIPPCAICSTPERVFLDYLRRETGADSLIVDYSGISQEGPLQVVAAERSALLVELLKRMLQNSNNLYAEAILKSISHHHSGEPGSWTDGARLLREFLVDSLELEENFQLVDGSGMSRYNLLSPAQLTLYLYRIQTRPWFSQFSRALAVMGHSGTLARRSLHLPGTRVLGKTGTLRNHKLLAGYLENNSGVRWIFSLNVEGFRSDYHRMEQLQDRFLAELGRLGRP